MIVTIGEAAMSEAQLDRRAIDTIRFLSVDMVQEAKSGHPGLPLGAAPMAYVLWSRFLRHNPRNPGFWDRDRFVLSAGHGSALLYSLLHLTGYDLSLEQIKQFRQWGSLTPGHPERGLTPGVEASTGPLGQGMGNALGMAIAEAHLAERFNRPGHIVFDHYTYVLAGDGDMMEGVESEAASLAGHLGLGKLIVLYDSNHVTLSATTSLAFSEDVGARHQAYGWHVQSVGDGNDVAAIERALHAAQEARDRPSLIIVQTVLGYGAPAKQGTFEAHGNPLGPVEVKKTKQNLGWPTEPPFLIPADVRAHLGSAIERGQALERGWQARFEAYRREFPDLAREIERRFAGELPDGWSAKLPVFPNDAPAIATRKASESVLQEIARVLPELVGGSGDLDPSTYTGLKSAGDFEATSTSLRGAQGLLGGGAGFSGRNIHFGVREHVMGAAVNGMAYHGGLLPFAATFLVFSDYMRPPTRMAALAELRALFVFTHDSIGVGEDGPTHQPIEQLAALRAIPQLQVIRPADANETRWAWQVAIEHTGGPSALVLSRQNLPVLDRSRYAPAEMLRYGAYVLNIEVSEPDLILIATGSEVQLIVAAEPQLRAAGLRARLVSMPCWRIFEQQSPAYRESVFPRAVRARLAVEAGSPLGWERYVGLDGAVLGIDRFGASAPGATVLERFGFSAQCVVERALLLKRGAK
jgi:transketolase